MIFETGIFLVGVMTIPILLIISYWIAESGRTLELELEEDANNILFQKYGYLSDQQLIETFYRELEQLEEQHQQFIKYKQDELHKQLIEWCAKNRKHLTEKKIKDMKVFL